MSRAARFYNPQFDLFLPSIVDLKFRDQKDTMERPFFSLSKSKWMKPIEYRNEHDGISHAKHAQDVPKAASGRKTPTPEFRRVELGLEGRRNRAGVATTL